MTVLVAVPYFGTAAYVERCVDSVLRQTHRDLVCVVIGDGERPPIAWTHPRLVVHSYAVNRGPYFAQDVAIWASPFELYAPVGSDDWLDPDHLERLVELEQDAACGAVWAHGDGPEWCGPGNDGHALCRGVELRRSYEVGLYRTERYREIGAHNPGERIGQDSLTLALMRLVAPVGASEIPTYNRRFRPGSLSSSPATVKGSPARSAMRYRNRVILRRCEQIARAPRPARDPAYRAQRIRQYREALVPPRLRAALDLEVAALRSKLVALELAA